eukprot:1201169-Pyramimonas_sp.AAC.1
MRRRRRKEGGGGMDGPQEQGGLSARSPLAHRRLAVAEARRPSLQGGAAIGAISADMAGGAARSCKDIANDTWWGTQPKAAETL